jgi:hypothetical protein
MAIERGDQVRATTAGGNTVLMRALGAPRPGRDFEVVWVATEDEWTRAQADGDEPDGLPWPTSAIETLATA